MVTAKKPVEILKATIADLPGLQSISRQTFSETFSPDNTEENMRNYIDESFSRERLSEELTDPNSEFFLAKLDNHTVGYLKVNHGNSQTELKDEKGLEIERIYVLQEFQGLHIGQALFQKVLKIAREVGVNYVWLGVWEQNIKAINFYRKNGFLEFDKHIFRLGTDEQTDIMMKVYL